MGNKKVIFILGAIFLIGIIFANFVSAEMLTSNASVSYDAELIGQFLFSHWVPVMVDVKDFSNITVSKEDSIEVQKVKDMKKYEILNNVTESVLRKLSKDEFQLEGREGVYWFYGNITKKGFEKLLNDTNVKIIYDNSVKGHITLYESAPLINADDAWASGYNGTGQTVCIIDTGVDYTHSYLGSCTQEQFPLKFINKDTLKRI